MLSRLKFHCSIYLLMSGHPSQILPLFGFLSFDVLALHPRLRRGVTFLPYGYLRLLMASACLCVIWYDDAI